MGIEIKPEPTEAERAAILAALELERAETAASAAPEIEPEGE